MLKLRFKYKPTDADRETLRLCGFVYDKHHQTWTGADTEYNRLLAETFKEDGHGTVTFMG